LVGRVQSGKGDASKWLHLYARAYEQKLGQKIFPGSLNVALDSSFDWYQDEYRTKHIIFNRSEMNGERDVLLMRCVLANLSGQPAFLWTTTTAAKDRPDPHVVELIASNGLRDRYALSDGDLVEIEIL
jgi:CTP-dependent riboflavin kinase